MRDISVPTGRSQRLAAKRAALKSNMNANQENENQKTRAKTRSGKRSMSDMTSPGNAPVTRKRTAFGDITNAIHMHTERIALGRKKNATSSSKTATTTTSKSTSKSTKIQPKKTRLSIKKEKEEENVVIPEIVLGSDHISSSNENKSTSIASFNNDNCSMLEDSVLNDSSESVKSRPIPKIPGELLHGTPESKLKSPGTVKLPAGVKPYDIDQDPNVVSEYADSIFRNMKKRELKFAVQNYLIQENTETTGAMRAILVDWLVEVQENFELYHETLYLAVKIADFYLQSNKTPKELLQLVGATALLISCKVEERSPPPLDDFQFICDDAYTHKQFVEMEMKILKGLDFDINIPISYRFLRRYARVTSMSMQILTLSRYILELSLQDASFVDTRPSKIAAACLCLALKLKNESKWDANFYYHTGYDEREVSKTVQQLNIMVTDAPKSKLQTIRTKYSHTIFYEVAKTPPLET